MPGLMDIKGIGEQAKKALVEAYGTEEEALGALTRGEFDQLLSLDAIPVQKRVQIAREVFSKKQGFEYADIMGTPEARKAFLAVADIIGGYVGTPYGRAALGLWYPTCDRDEIGRRQGVVNRAAAMVKGLGGDSLASLKDAISGTRALELLGKARASDVLVTDDPDVFQELGRVTDRAVLLEREEDMASLEGHPMVRYVQGKNSRMSALMESLPNVETFYGFTIEDVLPEAIMGFFFRNRDTIISASRALAMMGAEVLGDPGIDRDSLADAVTVLEKVEGDSVAGLDDTLKSFARAEDDFARVAADCLVLANDAVLGEVEERSVSLGGGDLLRVLENMGGHGGGSIYRHVPGEIMDVIREVAERWEAECAGKLGLADEAVAFSGLFSSELRYPLEMSPEDEARLESWISSQRRRLELKVKQETASHFEGLEGDVRKLVAFVLDLDLTLALGGFALDYALCQPDVSDSVGMVFEGGRNLLLLKEEKKGHMKVQPVDYRLTDERVAVLTGANSGGKTTLLETMVQIQLMAQCGLPVPAVTARVPVLERVFYFGKSRGGTDAGAFETLLRSFAGISRFKGAKLVLADEIEAVTEPGAAARIIAAIIEWFARDDGCLMVLVTHLGEDIKDVLPPGVRIDGIQARGLDEELNLIVDRNPVMGMLARSTPELIVERLAGEEKDGFFRAISMRFKKQSLKRKMDN